MAGMRPEQASENATRCYEGIQPDQLGAMPSEAPSAGFRPFQVEAMPPEVFAGFLTNQVEAMPPRALEEYNRIN